MSDESDSALFIVEITLMPPFPKESPIEVRTPQARLLVVLSEEDCPPLTKIKLAEAAGFSPGSGTIVTALNGVREGSSHGSACLGLLEMGFVQRFSLDIDGIEEVVHVITEEGREALRDYMETHGGLPKMRSKEASTNRRYSGGKKLYEEGQAEG
jgi:hypothetical protein